MKGLDLGADDYMTKPFEIAEFEPGNPGPHPHHSQPKLDERVKGLDLGADDYMTKPFEIAEFEARVRCLLRILLEAYASAGTGCARTWSNSALLHSTPSNERWFWTTNPSNSPGGSEACWKQSIPASHSRAGRVVPKKHIQLTKREHLCSFDEDVGAPAIDTYIHRLRRSTTP